MVFQVQSELEVFRNQVGESLMQLKQKFDMNLTKVDSMDLSYDKRISNLEAVITPLITKATQEKESVSEEEVVNLIEN